jgi:soluble cytochrome b562
MESMPWKKKETEREEESTDMDDQREAVRRLVQDEIRSALDEELKMATQELLEEQKAAIKQMVEEQKRVIREVVDGERKEIWVRLEEIRQAISKIGLGE